MPVRSISLASATIQVFPDAEAACLAAASRIAETVHQAIDARGRATLGLATGATPLPVYRNLVAAHQAGKLSFAQVSTFNLDEYYPMAPTDPQSYRRYMDQHLFNHVDIKSNAAHVFDGTVPETFANEYAAQFDRWIAAEGGLDLQLLGIGRNGHIGFNEPADLPVDQAVRLPSRVMSLHPVTIADAAADFDGEAHVPRQAITLGVGSILMARTILVLAFGAKKAPIVARALEGPITAEVPASLLRTVPAERVTWMVDRAAIADLAI